MGTSIDHKSWKKDHERWLTIDKKWQGDQKKVARAVESLEKYLKKHNQDLKSFLKKAKAEKSMINGKRHTAGLHKSLKKAHTKRNRYHAIQTKSHRNLVKLSKTIENTLRGLN